MDKFTLTCLLTALSGILLIYYTSTSLKPIHLAISDLNQDLVGRKVWITGKIVSVAYSRKGHVFLTLADNSSSVEVPIFSSLYKALNKPKFKKGQTLLISGFVDEYKGKLQVIPRQPRDVKVLR